MKHRRFEQLIFDRGAGLSRKESDSLVEHLVLCKECRDLAESWGELGALLEAAPSEAPSPGFTQRWALRYANRRQEMDRRQIKLVLGLTVGGLIGLSLLFGAQILESLVPVAGTIMTWILAILRFGESVTTVGRIALRIVQDLLGGIPSSYLLGIFTLFSGLLIVWSSTMYKLTFESVRRE